MQSEEKASEEKREINEMKEPRPIYVELGVVLRGVGVLLAVIGLMLGGLFGGLYWAMTQVEKRIKSELLLEIGNVAGDVRDVSKDLEIQAKEFNLILREFRTEMEDLRDSIDLLQQVTEPQAYESLRIGVLEDNSPFSEYIDVTGMWQGEDFTIVEGLRGVFGLPEERIEYLPMGDLTDMAANPCDYDFSFVDLDVWQPPSGYDFRYISVSDFFPATMTQAWTHAIVVPICEHGDVRFAFDLYLAKLKASSE